VKIANFKLDTSSVLHITVSLLRLYFDLCLFSCLFTLIVVFVIYCFVLPIVANKDLQKISHKRYTAKFTINSSRPINNRKSHAVDMM